MKADLLTRARREGNPLIDGTSATWVWHGAHAPQLVGDFNQWNGDEPIELKQIASRVWKIALDFPRDAYIEYAFVRHGARIIDPLNSRRVFNGIREYNHFFFMPEAAPTALIERRKGIRRGTLTRLVITTNAIAGGKRTVWLYQPPVAEPCPLLIVFDGRDYLKRAYLMQIITNLIGLGKIQPVALALIDTGTAARIAELAGSESMLFFLLNELLPLAQAQLNLTTPGDWGLLGASLGGLMALHAALRCPEIFNRVLSQSGALSVFGCDSLVFDLVRAHYNRDLKIWLDAGRFEFLLGANQRLADVLRANDYAVTYREYNGGHNYTVWRDEIEHGLLALFGR
jgi:enterochelin esterase family protein